MILHANFKNAVPAPALETRVPFGCQLADAAFGKTFATINPAAGKHIANVTSCGVRDVNRAVTAASRALAFGAWSRMAPQQRKAQMARFADLIDVNPFSDENKPNQGTILKHYHGGER